MCKKHSTHAHCVLSFVQLFLLSLYFIPSFSDQLLNIVEYNTAEASLGSAITSPTITEVLLQVDVRLLQELPTVTTDIILKGTCEGIGCSNKFISGERKVRVLSVSGDCTLVLESITLRDGYASSGSGGGALFISNAATVRVLDSRISGSSAEKSGGGIHVSVSTLEVRSSIITGCRAEEFGGGLYSSGSTVVVESSTFQYSQAGRDGGGVYASYGTQLSLEAAAVTSNQAGTKGGGLGAFFSCVVYDTTTGIPTESNTKVSVAESEIKQNSGQTGAGIYVGEGSDLSVRDTTVIGSNAAGDGGGMAVAARASVSATSSVLQANMAWRGGAFAFLEDDGGAAELLQLELKENSAECGRDFFWTHQSEGAGLGPECTECVAADSYEGELSVASTAATYAATRLGQCWGGEQACGGTDVQALQ
ncbi:hypothetical protein CYMTET_24246, partial [Cymbomonas tetramitiformis]